MKPPAAFVPTDAQRRFLSQIKGDPTYQSITQICQAADVHPSSYYHWCQDPGFRRWLLQEWSATLLFEGWHMLNLARAHMVRSPTHFRALYRLVFERPGQDALAHWGGLAGELAPGSAGLAAEPGRVECHSQSNQSLDPENSSFSPSPRRLAPAHSASPTRLARFLAQAIARASRPRLRRSA